MQPIAHTIAESATLAHTTETKIRSEIMSGRLQAHVAPDGRILITAQALAAYVASMPRFQPVTPESLADQVRQDAAARARGRDLANKILGRKV